MALGLVNDNKVAVDRFLFEQMAWAPATGIAGTCLCDDEERFIYAWFQASATAATFARYDTFGDAWQLLATPATVTGTINSMVFSKTVGSQLSGQVDGSIYLFNGNGTTCYFYKYDIGTNVWSTNLGTTNVPASFGTDACLCYPAPSKNNYETTYHSGVTRTITTTAAAAAGATTISVASLPEALASGTILRFNAYDVTISAAAAKGAVTLTVTGNTEAMKAGTVFRTKDGREFCLSQDSLASAGTLNIQPLQRDILAGSKFSCEKFAVLTAAAALNATSLTVSALRVGIPNASTAPYYGNMYLIGNNSAVMYRYNIGGNAWSTTSANSANPAIPTVTGACGAGCALKFLPAYNPDLLYIIRGTGTSNIYTYNLVNNTFAALTYYPSSETFTTGSNVAARSAGGKQASLIIQKDVSNKFFEFVPYKNKLEPKLTQQQYPQGTAVVGDKMSILTSPDGIDYLYVLLNSSTSFNRCPLVDS
jgi:hypothetical protein